MIVRDETCPHCGAYLRLHRPATLDEKMTTRDRVYCLHCHGWSIPGRGFPLEDGPTGSTQNVLIGYDYTKKLADGFVEVILMLAKKGTR
jgi:hypothetical protein